MKQKEPIYNRIWFLWLVLFSFYLFPYLFLFEGPPTGFLYGVWIVMMSLGLFLPPVSGVLGLLVLLFFFWAADVIASRLQITNPIKRLLFNLLCLLSLAISFGFVINGEWPALKQLNCSIHFYDEKQLPECMPRDIVL